MNREETKALLEREEVLRPIKQAFADGATVQINAGGWEDLYSPAWDGATENYRIKPKPKEIWVNESGGAFITYASKEAAEQASVCYRCQEVAKLYREVTE